MNVVTALAVALAIAFAIAAAVYRDRAARSGELLHRLATELDTTTDALFTKLEQLARDLESAHAERALFNAILDDMPAGVILVRRDHKISYMNRAARRLVLVEPYDARTAPLGSIKLTMELSDFITKTLEDESPETREFELELGAPAGRTVLVRIRPITEPRSDHAAVVLLEDLTEVRRYERLKRSLVSDFSHELRTPLSTVRTTLEALVEFGGLEEPERARSYLRRALEQVENMAGLVDRMLQLARLEAEPEKVLVRGEFRLGDLVRRVVSELAVRSEARRVAIELRIDRDGTLYADERLLGLAVANLLDNAIKYSPEGSSVMVEATVDDHRARVSVADRGPGIDPDDLPQLFRRFFRGERHRGQGGYGLGLSLVKHIVTAHSGTVTGENLPSGGARFTIEIPRG